MPTAVLDVELSQPPQPLTGLGRAAKARCLVRLHGMPLGYIEVPLQNGTCSAHTVRAAAVERLAGPLLRQHLLNLLSSATPQTRWRVEDALDARPTPRTLPLPAITVAVCTRDRPEDLRRCLEALMGLEYPALDLLVVDNAGRTDATERVVRDYAPLVRYVREDRPGLDWARNRAVLEARGEVVAFADDDVIVDPGWARALGEVFAENPGVMAVTGLVVPFELETGAQQLFEQYGGFGRGFERRWYVHDPSSGQGAGLYAGGAGQFGTGANMAYRRSLFDRIGFFDPALDVGTVTNGGGDLEMFFRVIKEGYPLVYEPRAIVRHRHRRDYGALRTQIANNGVGFYSYLVRSALAYPDERAELLRLGAWWFGYWDVRRLLGSFVRPPAVPRDLIVAELKGAVQGLFRYPRARRQAEALARSGDPPASPTNARNRGNAPRAPGVAMRHVHLEELPEDLGDVTEFSDVRVVVFRQGRPIGTVEINNRRQPVSGGRLREAIVDALGLSLLHPGEPADLVYARWAVALQERYVPEAAEEPEALAPDVPVSVVLATLDRPDDLREALRGLTAQNTPRPLEVIVVDNNPASGRTPPVVAEFPGVRLIEERRQGLAYARNAGFLASRGEIVATTDDDVIVPPDWIERLAAPFARADVLAVTGNVLPLTLDTPAQRFFEQYGGLGRGFLRREVDGAWFRAFRRRAVPTWELGATANSAFRASIFRDPEIGLMDEALGPGMPSGVGEDTYLYYKVLKAGGTLVYEPAAYLWHKHRRDMAALRRQMYAYSKGHVAYHLTTWLRDGDARGLLHLLVHVPWWRVRQVAGSLRRAARGQEHFPFSLLALEIRGNLAGPWALWRSSARVQREGRSRPPVEREVPLPAGLPLPLRSAGAESLP
ncbi:glycosyltransferase family 2 protein [Deinococcus sp. YIM 77859]|uniref:glycosyltransferase family 2 protein n=1 Tax=Deinococcus sp. YIM 77859 TaxID=1540221 RepID=UPI0018CCEE30|nr:glycosyltransferase family 2 protein [Deinococcus sp. YIM 77859]